MYRSVPLFALLLLSAFGEAAFSRGNEAATVSLQGEEVWRVEQWTAADGLPVETISSLVQTRDGYLWLATFDGLVRFDGVRFTVFDTVNVPELGTNRIVNLNATSDGALWIVTELGQVLRLQGDRFEPIFSGAWTGGLTLMNGKIWSFTGGGIHLAEGNQLVPIIMNEQLPGDQTSVFQGTNGLWIGTTEGLVVLEGGALREIPRRNAKDGETTRIYKVLGDSSGTVWLGTEAGLGRVTGEAWEIVAHHGLTIADLGFPARDPEGLGQPICLIRHREDLYQMDGWLEDLERAIDSNFGWELKLLQDSDESSWLFFGEGVFRDGREIYRAPSAITSLVIDSDDDVWLTTLRHGLFSLRAPRVTMLSDANVTALEEDRYGRLWAIRETAVHEVATDQSVDCRAQVMSLWQDPHGPLMAGDRAFALFEIEEMSCLSVGRPVWMTYAMHRTADGRFLRGTDKGLIIDGNSDEDPVPVRSIHERANGAIWLGTIDRGLRRLSPDGETLTITTDHGLPSNLVRDIHEDDTGMLWIATEDRGLARLDPRSVDAGSPEIGIIAKADGLFDNSLHQILEADGFFWISTNRGIFRVLRGDLEAFLRGEIHRVDSVAYTEQDGMREREANGGYQHAGLKGRDGRLYFATQNGVAVLDPGELTSDLHPPPVLIERLVAEDREISGFEPVVLRPDERNFVLEYTSTSLRAPERIRFEYRLEGYDEAWIDAGERREARYAKVPPETYSFRVRARSADGIWNEAEPLRIVVRPYFYETTPFRFMLGIVALLGIFLFSEYRHQKQRRRSIELEKQLEEAVADRTMVLEERAERLAEVDRLRADLFADVSHEFRTPLTLIIGPLHDLLHEKDILPSEAQQQMELAARNAERLTGLVEQILDIARLDSGRLELRVRHGDLRELLADQAECFQALAERCGLTFRAQPHPEPVPLWGDPDQLDKIFANLLSNAMRYTPTGGRVEMKIESVNSDMVTVAVRDGGPGIAPEDRERIFERFERGARTPLHGEGGTGLGLPLARNLAQMHGGDLTVESRLGQGSVFRVKLQRRREYFQEEQIDEHAPWHAPTLPATGTVQEAMVIHDEAPMERTMVLVVDDHPDVRSYVRRHLEDTYRVVEAVDGAQALELARSLLPDLVISDVMMPKMDGFELCCELKSDEELDWVPVVLLTAKASAEARLKGLYIGADDYIDKPFDVRELKARVQNLIASRRRLRERFSHSRATIETRLPIAPGASPTPDDYAWLRRMQEAIEANLDKDDFSVETLARELAVHRSRLFRRTRELTGKTPTELVYQIRLDHAVELLREPGSISEVAYAVGFQSVAHFSRRFRERFKESPSAWRRQMALTAVSSTSKVMVSHHAEP